VLAYNEQVAVRLGQHRAETPGSFIVFEHKLLVVRSRSPRARKNK